MTKLGKQEYDESIGEMKDADELINRILFLDGLPNVHVAHHRAAGRRNAAARAAGGDRHQIILARKQPAGLDPATCIASEPETWTAFAILSGVSSEALAGEQLLIDQNAWLRAVWRPGEPGNWTNPQSFATVVREIAAQPIAADAAGGHVHHH